MSESLAVLVTTNSCWPTSSRAVWTGSTGGTLISLTTTSKVLIALRMGVPLSQTKVVNVLVLGPCASVGVQLITPLPSIIAPAGAVMKVYANAWGGKSLSIAVFVTVRVVNSAMV